MLLNFKQARVLLNLSSIDLVSRKKFSRKLLTLWLKEAINKLLEDKLEKENKCLIKLKLKLRKKKK